jgi:outer membrane biosynthesis protein TonB
MGRLSAYLLALLCGAAATVGLAACGGSSNSGLLPGSTASEINSNLDKVQQRVAEGECAGAEEATAEISGQIEGLGGVNSRLKEALSEGAARLADVVATCEEVPNEEEAEEAQALKDAEVAAEEDEAEEKKEKPDKPKPGKEKEDKEPPAEPPEPPGQEEKEELPPTEEDSGGTNSGGVGPAAPAEGE